ncbi:MAG: hypothetical protein NVS3B25_35130 [Hymenobacter sp.]
MTDYQDLLPENWHGQPAIPRDAKSLLLAIDFDDTIAVNDCYPAIGAELPGAIAGLHQLAAAGHRLQIWTCRHGEALDNARAWLDARSVRYERMNENCPHLIAKWADTRKMSADVYIDDKNLGGLMPWPEIVSLVSHEARRLVDKETCDRFRVLPRIIALSGKRGSGKDTVAKMLQQLAPWGFFKPASFAGKLKEFAKQLTGHGDVYSQQGKATVLPEWGMSVGELLQRLGTDAIRNGLHENAWVLACFADMRKDQHYLLTDCRFPNELAAIRARGGVVIRVEGDPLHQQGDGTRDDQHPSECALDDARFDWIIDNDGTLDELKAKVREMTEALLLHAAVPTPAV